MVLILISNEVAVAIARTIRRYGGRLMNKAKQRRWERHRAFRLSMLLITRFVFSRLVFESLVATINRHVHFHEWAFSVDVIRSIIKIRNIDRYLHMRQNNRMDKL